MENTETGCAVDGGPARNVEVPGRLRSVGATFTRMQIRSGLVVGLALVLGACDGGADPTTSTPPVDLPSSTSTTIPSMATSSTVVPTVEAADIIFTGGDVVTMDPDLGTVEAIAIRR